MEFFSWGKPNNFQLKQVANLSCGTCFLIFMHSFIIRIIARNIFEKYKEFSFGGSGKFSGLILDCSIIVLGFLG
jgi:hypothetical protein